MNEITEAVKLENYPREKNEKKRAVHLKLIIDW